MWGSTIERSQRFRQCTRASVVTIFALAMPVLAVAVCGAVEITEVVRTKAQLQVIVDGAALAGAQQLTTDRSLATSERARLAADAQAVAVAPNWTITTGAQADSKTGSMRVAQDAVRPSFFGSLLPPGGFHLTVSATAAAKGSLPLCVLGASSAGPDVVALDKSAVVTAANCLVQSNAGIQVKDGAYLSAGSTRSVAGATGSISPAPVTDAPAVSDPFASLSIVIPGGCKGEKLELDSGTTVLSPGVHCDKLTLSGSALVMLSPGEHYFTGGGFDVQDNAQIAGADVVMIFKGQYKMKFKDAATLSIEGRKSGLYAGFVLITDRSFKGNFSISSDRARKLYGTIYLPTATFDVSGSNNKVADQSPWTIVVASKLKVSDSANLVINSNYAGSVVPVPNGVGSGSVRLVN